MNNNEFDETLEGLFGNPIPKADQARKQNTLDSAVAEFSNEFSKEFESAARPTANRETNKTSWISSITEPIRSLFMNIPNNKMMYNAVGTAAIAVVAISLVFLMPSIQREETLVTLPGFALPKQERELADADEPAEPLELRAVRVAVNPTISTPIAPPESITGGGSDNFRLRAESPEISADFAVAYESAPVGGIATASLAESVQPEYLVRTQSIVQDQEKSRAALEQRLDLAEEYADYDANPIRFVAEEPVSTFSIDVDTASYSLVRSQLNSGFLPAPDAVRAEELINYFDYSYPLPDSKTQPFEPTLSVLDSPWNEGKKLVHIGIKGYDITAEEAPDSNLVFLLDVSGSMSDANKLPLLKQSIALLLESLKPTDTVSIVVYAGAAGTVLETTEVQEKSKILTALNRLEAGGSTAGGAGIELAYQMAEQTFNEDAVNRVILATDGDFNVGQQSNDALQTLVERKRDNGVFLSVLGFGRNNYQDDMMQTLAQNGNGVAAYIDTLSEAKKMLVDEAISTLFPIAKDVKIQLEFNPALVSDYRLVGYETRALNREDFNNDKVDAGDIGAGHTVTAIYEITPVDAENQTVDALRYAENQPAIIQTGESAFDGTASNEYGFLKIRYKLPEETESRLIEQAIPAVTTDVSQDVGFSVSVAGFAQLLAGNQYTGDLDYGDVIKTATETKGSDTFGYRSEFIQLVRMAEIARP